MSGLMAEWIIAWVDESFHGWMDGGLGVYTHGWMDE